ncbi:hypothetical protein [Burkholderia cenocepacia]|uniref:hypothetical protein n=1 Tax=Burkholderia cenocepacia TaxID=95486 RepID=UPI00264DFBC1|nr:hypothetical protein [Burkholderia cenocepacia]MDN7683903.1 hypothetical protein [Burkholderia cenocepacia]
MISYGKETLDDSSPPHVGTAMNAQPIPRPVVFLLDRNVVAIIKDAIAGGKRHDARKQAYLDGLRALDVPGNTMSPILSIMEGERGYEDSAEEKAECLKKEVDAVGQFFKHASTDAVYLRAHSDDAAALFAGWRESQWADRATFFLAAAELVAQKVAAHERRRVEDELVRRAVAAGLATHDAILMVLLSCLYGCDAARRVIKPTKPNARNVLHDIHVISRVGMIKAVAQQSPFPINVRFLTLDQGLLGILEHIRIVRPRITAAGDPEMQVGYSPALFPVLSTADANALLRRCTSAASAAAK